WARGSCAITTFGSMEPDGTWNGSASAVFAAIASKTITTRSVVPRSQFGSRMYSPLCRAAHGDAIHPQRRLANADRHALAVLAAGTDAWVEREVAADHGNAVQICRP